MPNVAVLLRMCRNMSSVSVTFDKLSSFRIMPSVSRPTDTAPEREESVMRYS